MEENIKEYLEERKNIVNNYLNVALEKIREDSPLYAAINYSLMAGGKRLRPIMLIATYESNVDNYKTILPFASAIEMIHTYSLIHDDLPIMDNSDYRRGKPTCHKIYGSDMALLAGDALISLAFEIISSKKLLEDFDAKSVLRIVYDFAELSGAKGLVGGQVMDMVSMDMNEVDENLILYIEKRKTASLFMLAVRVGGILANVSEDELINLTQFAENFGISYQIQDDILDEISTTEELGKDTHQDRKNKKATFVSLYGVDRSKEIARDYIEKAANYLSLYNDKYKLLIDIAYNTLERIK
ncbi:polyprenyl synthetase family protein [Caldisericum sp. AR60]|uniref:polyprenyl synthetase family protein n=1 Tax=Caldisericum sp. AR60 TaxID=3397852 RepID=UPI0039FC90E6